MFCGNSQCNPALKQWLHSGCLSLHLILRRLQLKHPRRDLVWPFLGIGFRGSGDSLPRRPSDKVGDSLEEELSFILGSEDVISMDSTRRIQIYHARDREQQFHVAIYTLPTLCVM